MVDEELSLACNNDIKLYTKCFLDFYIRYKEADELMDTVEKIIRKVRLR